MDAARPHATGDRIGVGLSGLCAAHCVGTVALAGSLGAALANPLIHEIGLALALILGLVTFGSGLLRHTRPQPLVLGLSGLALMAFALAVPHGVEEAVLTVAGVALLAAGHWWNGRIAEAVTRT